MHGALTGSQYRCTAALCPPVLPYRSYYFKETHQAPQEHVELVEVVSGLPAVPQCTIVMDRTALNFAANVQWLCLQCLRELGVTAMPCVWDVMSGRL